MLDADTLAAHGVVVVREAFSAEDVAELSEELRSFGARALAAADTGVDPDFDERVQFRSGPQAAPLWGLDPLTRSHDERADPFREMSLAKAIREGPGWSTISALISHNAPFQVGARARVVDHRGGAPDDRRGAVFFHQEKWAIRSNGRGLGKNLWMFLTPADGIANLTTPGVQFALGEPEFWQQDLPDDAEYEATARPRISRLNTQSRASADNTEEFVEVDDYVIYRPHLRVGDILVFDHHVLHSSFVPASSTTGRVSCEFRVFPDVKPWLRKHLADARAAS